jgi:hypothetical protein
MINRSLGLAIFALAGCGTTAGVQEFQTYASAFSSVVEASDSVLNEMAAEEKTKRIRVIDGNSISDTLERKDIPLFAPSADPPFVASVRFAVHSVAEMNGILLAYAEGRALDGLKEDVAGLQAAGLGFSATEVAEPAAKAINAEILVLGEVLSFASDIGSREAFRAELVKASGQINTVLDVVLNQSTTAYRTLTSSEFRALRGSSPEQAVQIRQDIATEREMLAEWLYLIELSQVALNKAVSAATGSPDQNTRLVEAALLTGDLRARAERIKRLAAEN